MQNDNDTVIIKNQPFGIITTIIALACNAYCISISLSLWQKAGRHSNYVVVLKIFAGVTILLWVSAFLFMLYMILFRKDKVIIINSEGINDKSTLTSVGLIPWKNILKIEIKKTLGR